MDKGFSATLSNNVKSNIFDGIPEHSTQEIFSQLLSSGTTRVERIVSYGQCSDPDFWYDQDENEFVLLVSGSATLEVKADDSDIRQILLKPGDCLNIPAHQLHRVAATNQKEKTIWLAVFY